MKKEFGKKLSEKTEDIKKAVSAIAQDAKKETADAKQKVSAAARETDRKVGKAGNEMKASLQQMKKDIKEFPKKADKKNRK